jgi:hypothetical protein
VKKEKGSKKNDNKEKNKSINEEEPIEIFF